MDSCYIDCHQGGDGRRYASVHRVVVDWSTNSLTLPPTPHIKQTTTTKGSRTTVTTQTYGPTGTIGPTADQWLAAVNRRRANPALGGPVPPVLYSNYLAAQAAQLLKHNTETCSLTTDWLGYQSIQLVSFAFDAGSISAEATLTKWVDNEFSSYSFTNGCPGWGNCGDFSTVMWDKTEWIGCSVVKYEDPACWLNGIYLSLCNFRRPGMCGQGIFKPGVDCGWGSKTVPDDWPICTAPVINDWTQVTVLNGNGSAVAISSQPCAAESNKCRAAPGTWVAFGAFTSAGVPRFVSAQIDDSCEMLCSGTSFPGDPGVSDAVKYCYFILDPSLYTVRLRV